MNDHSVDVNKQVRPTTTDPRAVAEQLIEQMENYPGVSEHFREEWRAYYKQDIELLAHALAVALLAGMMKAGTQYRVTVQEIRP